MLGSYWCSAAAWLAAFVLAAANPAHAASWTPTRPVEIVIPTATGGGIDRTARTLQRIFQEQNIVRVPVTAVNRSGGGGAISLAYINRHAGDGHVIAINSPNLITSDLNGRSPVRYTGVTPLATLFSEYTVIAVRTD